MKQPKQTPPKRGGWPKGKPRGRKLAPEDGPGPESEPINTHDDSSYHEDQADAEQFAGVIVTAIRSARPLSINLRLARIEDAIEEQATTLDRIEGAVDRFVASLG